MKVGGYTLDLYCDRELDKTKVDGTTIWRHNISWPAQFVGHTYYQCKRQAQKDGWVFHRDGTHSCPDCVKRR